MRRANLNLFLKMTMVVVVAEQLAFAGLLCSSSSGSSSRGD